MWWINNKRKRSIMGLPRAQGYHKNQQTDKNSLKHLESTVWLVNNDSVSQFPETNILKGLIGIWACQPSLPIEWKHFGNFFPPIILPIDVSGKIWLKIAQQFQMRRNKDQRSSISLDIELFTSSWIIFYLSHLHQPPLILEQRHVKLFLYTLKGKYTPFS